MQFSQIKAQLSTAARFVTGTRRDPAIGRAVADAATSLARAEADHAREHAALGNDQSVLGRHQRLASSLREIRQDNHFSGTITAAFRGET